SRRAHGGAALARYWVHNGFVDMGSEKMAKSLGNIVTPNELLAKDNRGEIYRLALLSAHYRQPLSWTDDVVAQAKTNLDRLYRTVGDAQAVGEPDDGVLEALRDDLNTPLALTRLMAIKNAGAIKASASLLGLLQTTSEEWFRGLPVSSQTAYIALLPMTIEERIAERAAAKTNRDFASADRIRDELKAE